MQGRPASDMQRFVWKCSERSPQGEYKTDSYHGQPREYKTVVWQVTNKNPQGAPCRCHMTFSHYLTGYNLGLSKIPGALLRGTILQKCIDVTKS